MSCSKVEQWERAQVCFIQKGFNAHGHRLAWHVVTNKASTHTLLFVPCLMFYCSAIFFFLHVIFFITGATRCAEKNTLGNGSWLGKK